MKRLIQRGLMFGNLIEVSSPALVERYNRALKHLTGKTTKLDDFHIDLSGYSPEIGDELGDDLYFTVIRSFLRNFEKKRNVTTEEFIALANFVTKKDWKPFFEKYYYGIEMP